MVVDHNVYCVNTEKMVFVYVRLVEPKRRDSSIMSGAVPSYREYSRKLSSGNCRITAGLLELRNKYAIVRSCDLLRRIE